ncbi:membrane protein [Actinoplanes lobatus]|uniref:Membrane protein n=2 Tax=Actinoplanes TaxID=1865 RepID=A0A7W7HP95_9ACTN|nr:MULTISPECIES: DUF1269 domain-containing protein [Actinoplanes]MBB4754193.1 putative membrane protein [Actinoplanes lobatus]MBW6433600.1 DUF1269 domain-containing protein [Actinoplanes hulinensis]GGN77377.1 membrane protein [Actinoplanes lobatus]GIE40753.1 membrane protein [Actinoplanes lobatus]
MTTFTVWKFDDPQRAEQAAGILRHARDEGLVKIIDYAVVSWPQGAAAPETHHEHESGHRYTGWGAFWGIVIGGLFLVPVAGAAVGAGIGALVKATEGTGIDRQQLETIRAEITEGTSALFLVTDQGNLDRLGERFHGLHKQLIATNLTEGERDILLEAFGGATP